MRNPFAEKNPSESGKHQIKWYSCSQMVLKELDEFYLRADNKGEQISCNCVTLLLARLSVTSQIPKTFQPSKQQEGVSSLTSVKTYQHYLIIIIVVSQCVFNAFFLFYQYFALMLLLLLMELGVAIYLYIEKDKVRNEFKDI